VPVGAAIEHGADQARLEAFEEPQCLARAFAQATQAPRLILGIEQALVFAQGFLDFGILRQGGIDLDAQAHGGLALGCVVVADAVLADQARGFNRDAAPRFVASSGTVPVHQKIP
jgi:hypothetical protein